MNIAFLGFRHSHIGALYNEAQENKNVTILGAWEETQEGRDMAAPLGIDFNYPTIDALLGDPRVDIAVLGGYYGQRGAHAIAALQAGKHVYSDKPLCTSLSELDEIERLSAEKNLKVGCMFTLRYGAGIKTIRELILGGKLGEIGTVAFTAQHPLMYGSRPNWYFEDGKHGGVLNDIAIHGIDIIEFITGLKMKNVTAARTWNHFAKDEPQFRDCGHLMVELSNGAGVLADVSYAAPNSCGFSLPYYWRITFWGTKGVVEYQLNGDTVKLALDGDEGVHIITPEAYDGTCIEDFLAELRGEPSVITTEQVFRSTRDTLTIQATVK